MTGDKSADLILSILIALSIFGGLSIFGLILQNIRGKIGKE